MENTHSSWARQYFTSRSVPRLSPSRYVYLVLAMSRFLVFIQASRPSARTSCVWSHPRQTSMTSIPSLSCAHLGGTISLPDNPQNRLLLEIWERQRLRCLTTRLLYSTTLQIVMPQSRPPRPHRQIEVRLLLIPVAIQRRPPGLHHRPPPTYMY